MKYLITIASIILAFSLATIFIIWPESKPDEKDVVLTVNNSRITGSMLEQSEKQRASHHESRADFLNSVAIEQVMIQEAKRQKIDQEPAFREAIKEYYKQSLVKILLDRQNQKIDYDVSEEEIDTFISFFGKTITLTIAQGEGTVTPEIDWSTSHTTTELFDQLSSTLQPVVAGLQPGNTRAIYDTGNEWFAVKVDHIAGISNPENTAVPREMIHTIIATHKREQQLNNWVNRLIANAEISIKVEEE